jgi:hypothetical protein
MNILCAHGLIVHLHYVSWVSWSISLLVLIGVLKGLQILWTIVSLLLRLSAKNTWQLLGFLLIGSIHWETVVYTSHVLGGTEVLEDVLHVLTVCTHVGRWASSQCSLVMHATMGSFYTHISNIAWWNQIKRQFTWLDKLHVAYSSAHLMLSWHHSLRVHTTGVGFPMVLRIHSSRLATKALTLVFHLVSHLSYLIALHVHSHNFSIFLTVDISIWKCLRTSTSGSTRSNAILSEI